MEGAPALRAGYRLDRYELLCPIASGGMASVWLARLRGKRDFEKLFAIKTIKNELTEDARFQEMFLDEARIASGIEHPNVTHIIDLGEQDDILYIVMEWVDGESLAKIARLARKLGKPLPLGLSLRIVADACAGLHAAHELKDVKGNSLNVVHRDVSPHNILVTASGTVKVIDFGVAKAKNRRAGETGEGIVKGKIRYMAPEQVRSAPLDRRVDIWALGVCLYELVIGKLPFDDESDVEVVRRLLGDDPPPKAPESVPESVRNVLAHSLVRNPEERFATAAAMRRAVLTAISQLRLEATAEDVADFLRLNMQELAKRRRDVINKAIEEADARPADRSSGRSMPAAEEVAYAPTIVSERDPRTQRDASQLSGPMRKPMPSARALLEGRASPDESNATAMGTITEEVAGLPKSRGIGWFLAVLALGAVAWFVWPGAARLRAMARGQVMPAPAQPATDISSLPSTPPSASASAMPATSAAVTSASASASASARPAASSSAAEKASAAASAATASASAKHHHVEELPPPVPTPTMTVAPPPVETTNIIATATTTEAPPPPPPPTATATDTVPDRDNPY